MQAAAERNATDGFETFDLEDLRWDDRGLVTVVVQDATTAAVLMVAWADREALELTISSGRAHFWSRSRKQLWRKGETSGNELVVVDLRADCDRDTVLLRARPLGPACHQGTTTCFEGQPAELELGWLAAVLRERSGEPIERSYTARLLSQGLHRVAQKVGEEGVETVIAAMKCGLAESEGPVEASSASARSDDRAEFLGESADLLYHLLVLWQALGVAPREVGAELARRHFGDLPNASSGGAEEEVSS